MFLEFVVAVVAHTFWLEGVALVVSMWLSGGGGLGVSDFDLWEELCVWLA